jgi:hypothetical protein
MKALVCVLISFLVFLSLSCQNDNTIAPKEKAPIIKDNIKDGNNLITPDCDTTDCENKKFKVYYKLEACSYDYSREKSHCCDYIDLYQANYGYDIFSVPYNDDYNLTLYFRWQDCDGAGTGYDNSSHTIRAIFTMAYNVGTIEDPKWSTFFTDWMVKPYASESGDVTYYLAPLRVPNPSHNLQAGVQYLMQFSWEARY